MKKISKLIIIFILLFTSLPKIYAKTIITITGNEVRFRSSSTTDSDIITVLNSGDKLTLINKSVTGNGCDDSWYQATFNNQTGYVCSTFTALEEIKEEEEIENKEEYKDYKEYLKQQGFPDTYIPSLISLHEQHPNWDFKVKKVNYNFNSFLSIEYDGYSRGWSLIEDTGSYIDGYKSTDSWSYNYLTNVFNNNFTGGGKNWYQPSKQTISYYIDPRNFFNEKQIFMFESLSYNSAYHTKEGVEKMLASTFMTGYADTENEKTYADAFLAAATTYNVSPYVLISRVIQEVGSGGSTIVSGNVSGYEGYYNFYNIHAWGNNPTETINNGLQYAKDNDWSNPYKAIIGGASFLSNDYINVGQDTLYFQKWDIYGPKYGAHQYMQNIEAPSTESIKTYNGYKNINLLDSNFVFTIPVYDNMPEKTTLPNRGNPNNYLKTLAVNGNYLFESATTETNFELNLDGSTQSIDISASKVASTSTISGTGSISLTGTKTKIEVLVTAANGDKRTYTINVTRDETISLDISEILRLSEIKNDGTYIYGLSIGTTIENITNKLKEKEKTSEITIKDSEGNIKTKGEIASGDKVSIKTNREEKTYTIVLYGDVNKDGKITAADYMIIKNDIMDVKKMSDLEIILADVNKDGNITAADYAIIKNDIMDVKKIEQ